MAIVIKADVKHGLDGAITVAVENIERFAHKRLVQYAELLRDTAKINVLALRHAERPLPSELADSLHIEQVQRGSVKVVADAPHAVFVEFGTSTQDAQPFFSMAVLEVRASAPLD